MTEETHPSARIWLASTGVDPEMGGIASVARSCVKALAEIPGDSELPPMVVEKLICLNGFSDAQEIANPSERVSCNGRRPAFLAHMLNQAASAPDLLVFDHLDLAQCQALIPPPLRRPYVVWAHGIDIWCPLPFLKRRGLLGAACVLFNSEFTLRKALHCHPWLAAARTAIVPLCVESEPGRIQSEGAEGKKPWILTVGRLEANRPKGHREILEVLPNLVERIPGLEWHVAGTGGWLPELERLVEQSKAREHIFLHGFVEDEKLAELYEACRVFCMPSRGEGFGLVYAEAMRHGCVCVGSTLDAAREVLGDAGICVDPDDSKALSKALLCFLTMTPSEFEERSQVARRRAESFSPRQFRKDFVASLQSVLEANRS